MLFRSGACFGIELFIHNTAAVYYVDHFKLSLKEAGLAAGSFGLLALFARALGGWLSDKAAAEALRGTLVEIDEAALPPLEEGEYYLHDLLGLAVVTTGGERLGTLADVLTTGANDVYVLRREGKPDALIPAIPDVIRSVDLDARTMTIEPMPGLID